MSARIRIPPLAKLFVACLLLNTVLNYGFTALALPVGIPVPLLESSLILMIISFAWKGYFDVTSRRFVIGITCVAGGLFAVHVPGQLAEYGSDAARDFLSVVDLYFVVGCTRIGSRFSLRSASRRDAERAGAGFTLIGTLVITPGRLEGGISLWIARLTRVRAEAACVFVHVGCFGIAARYWQTLCNHCRMLRSQPGWRPRREGPASNGFPGRIGHQPGCAQFRSWGCPVGNAGRHACSRGAASEAPAPASIFRSGDRVAAPVSSAALLWSRERSPLGPLVSRKF
jgi:hypothetical protein